MTWEKWERECRAMAVRDGMTEAELDRMLSIHLDRPKPIKGKTAADVLKPCPFCASERVFVPAEGESGADARGRSNPYRANCQSCGAQTSAWFVRSLAIDAWNRRAPAESGA